jgi:hypothetical protein
MQQLIESPVCQCAVHLNGRQSMLKVDTNAP